MSVIGFIQQLVETKASGLGLNPYQIKTLKSLPQEAQEFFVSSRISTKEEAIDQLIVPFNLKKLDAGIRDKVAAGGYMVMMVNGDEGYSYSIGLTVNGKHSHELVIPYSIGAVAQLIINEIVEVYPDHEYPDTPIEVDCAQVDGQRLRIKIDKALHTSRAISKCFARLDRWTDRFPTAVYFIHVADKNNVLPGEPGYDTSMRPTINY